LSPHDEDFPFQNIPLAALCLVGLTAAPTMSLKARERVEKAVAVTASNKLLKFNVGRLAPFWRPHHWPVG
jgi:hypothetical protein